MVLKQNRSPAIDGLEFENDVKKYGTQTSVVIAKPLLLFENDVKKYGTQTFRRHCNSQEEFENDVKKYGTQTRRRLTWQTQQFENDVKKYGTQTSVADASDYLNGKKDDSSAMGTGLAVVPNVFTPQWRVNFCRNYRSDYY